FSGHGFSHHCVCRHVTSSSGPWAWPVRSARSARKLASRHVPGVEYPNLMWVGLERGPASLGTLLILLSRRATAADSPYQFAILVHQHGLLGRQHAPPPGWR